MKTRRVATRILAVILVCMLVGSIVGSSPHFASAAQTELITNGGYESGLVSPWVSIGNWYALSSNYPHTGTRYAHFTNASGNPGNNLYGQMYQQITIPSSATSAALTFWYNISTNDTGSTAHDFLLVTIRDSAGNVLEIVDHYNNTQAQGVGNYVQKSFPMTRYIGQTVRVDFTGSNDSSLETVFRIDDVSVIATIPNYYTLTTGVSPSSAAGYVTPASGTSYSEGTVVTVTATAYTGWVFDHWGGAAAGTSIQTTVTMNSDKSVTAYFVASPPQTGTISVTSSPSGASFSITGPANYSNTASWSTSGAPAGTYIITWGAMAGYTAPSPESRTLSSGSSISFSGVYQPSKNWTFAVITDLHIGRFLSDYAGEDYYLTERLKNAANEILGMNPKPAFVAVLGDISSNGDKQSYEKAKEILDNTLSLNGIPYVPVMGNHDTEGSNGRGDFQDVFWNNDTINKPLIRSRLGDFSDDGDSACFNYGFTCGGIRFIVLDNGQPGDPGAVYPTATKTWLHDELQRTDQDLKGMIVLSHVPIVDNNLLLFSAARLEEWATVAKQMGAYTQPTDFTFVSNEVMHSAKRVLGWYAGHIHGYDGTPILGEQTTQAEANTYMDGNIVYPWTLVDGTDQYVPVIGTEAMMVGNNESPESSQSTSKGMIRVVTVEPDIPKATDEIKGLGHALNPRFFGEAGVLCQSIFFHGDVFSSFDSWEGTYEWDFDFDGELEHFDAEDAGKIVHHTYTSPGNKKVALRVKDSESPQGEIMVNWVYVAEGDVCSTLHSVVDTVQTETTVVYRSATAAATSFLFNLPTPESVFHFNSPGVPVGSFLIHFEDATSDVDLSQLVADVDINARKSVLYMGVWPSEVDSSRVLYIPSTGAGAVYLCSGATSLAEVSVGDPNKIVVHVGETVNGISVTASYYEGQEYYVVSGVTGTGGGEMPAPNDPINVTPAYGAAGITTSPTLSSSAFSHHDGYLHAASQWQITTTLGDYTSPIFDSSVDSSNLTTITILPGALSRFTTYYWHVRYRDSYGNWSNWSVETPFTTITTSAILTLPATGVSATTATLNGEVTTSWVADLVSMAGGWSHSLGLRSDGTLWTWGGNYAGQLGLGDATGRLSPTQVGSDANWVAITAGWYHSLGVRSDGTLWAWGQNSRGQLGLGDTTDRLSPTRVGNDTNWLAVAGGGWHSVGLRSDGTVWAWGFNDQGQLGLGDTTDRLSPTQVGTATDWVALSAGSRHCVGLRSDGTLWAWGDNDVGQLGLGDTTDRLSPTQVGTATNWAATSVGSVHSLGLRSDGTLWAWGFHDYGRLGLGSITSPVTSPTQVGSATDWVAVSAGGYHSTGLRSDQSLWVWGSNSSGQLGLGDTTNRWIPTQAGSVTSSVVVAAGANHSLGRLSDGTLWACGDNYYGQLGLGDETYRLVPTEVSWISCRVSFEWGLTPSYGNETTSQTMTNVGIFSSSIGDLAPGTSYHFRAKAVGNGTAYGDDMTFITTTDNVPPPVPTLLSPANGTTINDSTPTLDWSDVTDPSGAYYWYQIDDSSDFSSPVLGWYVVPSEYTVEAALAEGMYYWRVRVVDGVGNTSDWTAAWCFTVDATVPLVPTLLYPANGRITKDSTPWLDWSDVTDATGVKYQLQVDNDADFSSLVFSKTGITASSRTVSTLPDGTYYWRVRAVDGAGNASDWTPAWTFTVDATVPLVPTLLYPSNGRITKDNTPWLDWSDVTDATGVRYQLQVDNNADFSSPVFSKTGMTASSRTLSTLADGTYYWRVRAVDGAGNASVWTAAWSFTIDTTTPSVPVLLYPTDGRVTSDTTPWLDWSDVTDATGVKYRLQVDNNADFSSPVVNKSGLTVSSRTLSTLSAGTYYWRVRVVDGAGNASAWTAAWSFTIV